jgi:D-inositol-3-phosphate glycosyltransferase
VAGGVTGLHVEPRRPDRIAAALRELLADPEKRRAFGRAGARRAAHRYGWDRIAGSTLRVYEQLVSREQVREHRARRATRREGVLR